MKRILAALLLAGCAGVSFLPDTSVPLDRPPTPGATNPSAAPLASTMPVPGTPTPPHIPIATEAHLRNGIRVLMLEDPTFPLVSVGAVLKRGAIDAPAGIFALFFDLMTSSSDLISPKALHSTLFDLGATRSTEVRVESSTLSTRFLPVVMHDAVRVVVPTLVSSTFDSDEYEKLLDAHRRAALKNHDEPAAMASRELQKLLYPTGSPYAADVADDPTLLTAAKLGTLRDLRAFVGADDVVVVAAGAFTAAKLLPLLEESLGPLKPGARAREGYPAVPIPTSAHVLAIDHPGDSQVQVALGFMCVPYDDPDYPALYFLGSVLQRGLHESMRLGHGLTYGVSGGISMMRTRAPLTVTAAVSDDAVKQALTDTFDSLKTFDARVRDPAELSRLKAWMMRAWPDTYDTVEQSMHELETIAKLDLPVDFWVKLRDSVQNVTADDLARVAKKYLDPAHAQLVVLGDVQRFKPDLDALGIAPVEVRRAH